MNNYTIVHLHSMLSNGTTNIDSVTKFEQYIEKIKLNNMNAVAFTEHGNIFSWLKKKETCERHGLKYIHAAEFYVTKSLDNKIRDNYHCCLYAKNWNGVQELNKLLTNAYNRSDGHFYYVPRITLDELFKTSNNIMITTACIGGILGKGDNEIKSNMVKFIVKNKDRCFLEIQHHLDIEQIKLNKYLYDLSNEYDLNLIVGTDTHALDDTHAKGRRILQKSKNVFFSDEDSWDITFKTYDELIDLYTEQNAIPMKDVVLALNNTNKLADMVEEFQVDRSYKYPKMSDNPEKILKEKIKKGIEDRGVYKKTNYKSEYIPRIKHELKTYKYNGAIDFLLLDEDIKSYAKSKNIHPGYSRGSVSGSEIAYLIGITDMDSIEHNLNFERFMNTERVSLADVDTDYPPSQRDIIKDYIFNKKGLYCSDIITFNTVALKGSIRDVGRALNVKLDIINNICENIEYKESEYRELYPELFEYVDIINGTVVSIGSHPCGLVCSPIPIDTNMGLLTLSTSKYPITMLNMKEIDSMNFVKLDILGLDNIEVINKVCEMANMERLTPDNVVDDENVWKSIREDTLGIFQWEGTGERYIKDLFSDETIDKIKSSNPNFKYIDLFSVGNGAIRPAGASYRDELAKGVFHDNGHTLLNEFLSPTLGYLVYQEQIMDFLHMFCGFTKGEADIVRRGFAKKTGTDQFIPKIKAGFLNTMKEKYNVEESESETIIEGFLKIIIDASDYLFSLNHSQSYSYIGYICGYLRYYYPLEFLTVLLNINDGKMDKTKKITEYANKVKIKIESPKFRYSKSEYMYNKDTNTIYKGIESIKFLNKECANQLYELRERKYNNFVELLDDIGENVNINSRQIEILIKLDYFSEFGKSLRLMQIYNLYTQLLNRKQIKKCDLQNLGLNENVVKKYSKKVTDKLYKDIDIKSILFEKIEQIEDKDINIKDKLNSEIEYLGYTSTILPNLNDNLYYVISIDEYKNKRSITYYPELYNIKTGETKKYKIKDYILFSENAISNGCLLENIIVTTENKRKLVNGKWVKSDELNYVITAWEVF